MIAEFPETLMIPPREGLRPVDSNQIRLRLAGIGQCQGSADDNERFTRLASLIDVDVASLDKHQLTRLMLAALSHVQARLLHGAGEQAAATDSQADSGG